MNQQKKHVFNNAMAGFFGTSVSIIVGTVIFLNTFPTNAEERRADEANRSYTDHKFELIQKDIAYLKQNSKDTKKKVDDTNEKLDKITEILLEK